MSKFALTQQQKAVRAEAAALAESILKPAYELYSKYPNQLDRFRATRPFYAKAVQAGFVKKMIPKAVGGASESWLDVAIALEEYYTVDASLTIHAVGTALGLLPLIIGGTPEQQKKYLAPFISGEGDHMASLTHSEPGGTANFLEKGGRGLGVTAKRVGDYYVVNGEKVRLRSCAGISVFWSLTLWVCSYGPQTVQAGMARAQHYPYYACDIRRLGVLRTPMLTLHTMSWSWRSRERSLLQMLPKHTKC